MAYGNSGYIHDDRDAYEMPSVQQASRTGGYVMASDGADDEQDDVPIHAKRQSRMGYSGTRYDDVGLDARRQEYDVNAFTTAATAPYARQSSYGGGYTDSSHMHERYSNPFEQPVPQPEDFDVMADFNNAGPRYSNLYGKGTDDSMRELVKSGGRANT